jgi:hypothetical protein
MSYNQPPPPPPPPGYSPPPAPPPGYGSPGYGPPGYGPPGGYYGPPQAPGAPAPQRSRSGSGPVLAVFIGALVGIGVLAGIIVLANQPPPPEACPVGQTCPHEPPPSLVPGHTIPPGQTLSPLQTPLPTPVGQTPGPGATALPTPASNAAPFVAGSVWSSRTLGYSFEYDPTDWTVNESDDAFADLLLGPAEFAMRGFPGDVSVQTALDTVLTQVDSFVIGRALNTRGYDAVLGSGIGYVRGEGAVYSGTFKNADGTPGEPVGITVMASTNGRVTIAVVVLVSNPDKKVGNGTLQHTARQIADNIIKTVLWDAQ